MAAAAQNGANLFCTHAQQQATGSGTIIGSGTPVNRPLARYRQGSGVPLAHLRERSLLQDANVAAAAKCVDKLRRRHRQVLGHAGERASELTNIQHKAASHTYSTAAAHGQQVSITYMQLTTKLSGNGDMGSIRYTTKRTDQQHSSKRPARL